MQTATSINPSFPNYNLDSKKKNLFGLETTDVNWKLSSTTREGWMSEERCIVYLIKDGYILIFIISPSTLPLRIPSSFKVLFSPSE